MASNAREARRRKIMERGADRLALITGQIQSLPSDNPNSDCSRPLDSNPINQGAPSNLSDQTAVAPAGENGAFGSMLTNHSPSTDVANEERSIEEIPLNEQEEDEALEVSATDGSNNFQSRLVSSSDQKSTECLLDTEQRLEPHAHRSRALASKQIVSAISATENSRLFASVTIALLVILSYLGLPVLSNYVIKGILSFRPLYLVLLTNITLVIVRLLFTSKFGFEMPSGDEYTMPSTGNWTEQAGNALEVALLMQKAMDAIFMDCSVYAAVIICGLSFLY